MALIFWPIAGRDLLRVFNPHGNAHGGAGGGVARGVGIVGWGQVVSAM